MNSFWLPDLFQNNTVALWVFGLVLASATVFLSTRIRSSIWRSGVVGVGTMLFIAPMYQIFLFDPQWGPPWPSAYITAAVSTGDLQLLACFFQPDFLLPPIGWGVLAALASYAVSALLCRRQALGPPPFV